MKRHFNQAEVLATMLGPDLTPPIERSLLVKRRSIPSQTSLNQCERAINVYGAFKLKHPAKALNGSFLLVDDVLTTGATANETARLLKLHGAKRVDFLALARTVSPEEKQAPECRMPNIAHGKDIRKTVSPEKQFEIHAPHG